MNDWHKRHVEFWKSKLGVSDYGMLSIASRALLFIGIRHCFYILTASLLKKRSLYRLRHHAFYKKCLALTCYCLGKREN